MVVYSVKAIDIERIVWANQPMVHSNRRSRAAYSSQGIFSVYSEWAKSYLNAFRTLQPTGPVYA